MIVTSSVRARHSSSSRVERNFAYSNFLLVLFILLSCVVALLVLLFSFPLPVFFRDCSPPSYHIQSTWTQNQFKWESYRRKPWCYIGSLANCAKMANLHFGKKWHCDHYKQLPENSSSACTEAFICFHYSHLLAGASKQSWDASIAITIAFLIHKVHLGTNTFSLSANFMRTN